MGHARAFPLAWLKQGRQLRCLCHLSPQPTTRLSYARRMITRAMATATGKKTSVKERTVAGSFLFKIPNGDDKQAKVALFRRSSKVRTYQ